MCVFKLWLSSSRNTKEVKCFVGETTVRILQAYSICHHLVEVVLPSVKLSLFLFLPSQQEYSTLKGMKLFIATPWMEYYSLFRYTLSVYINVHLKMSWHSYIWAIYIYYHLFTSVKSFLSIWCFQEQSSAKLMPLKMLKLSLLWDFSCYSPLFFLG